MSNQNGDRRNVGDGYQPSKINNGYQPTTSESRPANPPTGGSGGQKK